MHIINSYHTSWAMFFQKHFFLGSYSAGFVKYQEIRVFPLLGIALPLCEEDTVRYPHLPWRPIP